MNDTLWDAIIIGAGPAGSSLAILLARSGARVLLVDQAKFPRTKVCGGCLNGNALAALRHLGLEELPKQLGGHAVAALQLASQGRSAQIPLDEGISISRHAFDTAIVDAGKQVGAIVRTGVRASLDKDRGDFASVTLRDANASTPAKARIVILAHGLKAGTISPNSRLGAGVVLDDIPNGYPLHTIMMAVGSGGYVGGVPVEDGRYDLAAAFDSTSVQLQGSLGQVAVTILREAGFPAIPNLETANWKGTPLLTRTATRIAGHRWFAVGDAAGYVEPFTGEGMAWAMTGAIALAPIVMSAIRDWKPSHAKSWMNTHRQIVTRRQWTCRLMSKLLRSPRGTSLVVRSLSVMPILSRPFVRNLNRPSARFPGVAS